MWNILQQGLSGMAGAGNVQSWPDCCKNNYNCI